MPQENNLDELHKRMATPPSQGYFRPTHIPCFNELMNGLVAAVEGIDTGAVEDQAKEQSYRNRNIFIHASLMRGMRTGVDRSFVKMTHIEQLALKYLNTSPHTCDRSDVDKANIARLLAGDLAQKLNQFALTYVERHRSGFSVGDVQPFRNYIMNNLTVALVAKEVAARIRQGGRGGGVFVHSSQQLPVRKEEGAKPQGLVKSSEETLPDRSSMTRRPSMPATSRESRPAPVRRYYSTIDLQDLPEVPTEVPTDLPTQSSSRAILEGLPEAPSYDPRLEALLPKEPSHNPKLKRESKPKRESKRRLLGA